MSRIKQNQNIDSLILNIDTILKNRCSFSEVDINFLDEALQMLQNLKGKKGRTNKETLEIVSNVLFVLAKFFKNDFIKENK